MRRESIYIILYFLFEVIRPIRTEEKVRMCYITTWSKLREGIGRFTPSDLDPFLCTHVICAYVNVSNDGTTLVLRDDRDISFLEEAVALKQRNPALKVLVSVGGNDVQQRTNFQRMARQTARIAAFAASCRDFLSRHGLDGLDLAWEHPQPVHRISFQLLIAYLWLNFNKESQVSKREQFMITVSVKANHTIIQSHYDPVQIVRFVDYFLLVTFNMWDAEDSTRLGHHSPLSVETHDDLDNKHSAPTMSRVVSAWLQANVPATQLVLGLAAFGHTARLSSPGPGAQLAFTLGANHTGLAGSLGPITQQPGILAYYEICQKLNQSSGRNWNEFYDTTAEGVLAFDPRPPYHWACYDNPRSFQAKAAFAVQRGLAGVFVWAADLDDVTGTACNKGAYPLLSALALSLNTTSTFTSSASSSSTPSSVNTQPAPKTRSTSADAATVSLASHSSQPLATPTSVRIQSTSEAKTSSVDKSASATQTKPTTPSTVQCRPFLCPDSHSDDNPYHLYPDPYDCRRYYQCDDAFRGIRRSCPSYLHFHPQLLRCDYPDNAHCMPCG